MIFIDSGYLIALVRPRDELCARAEAWAAAISEPLLLTDVVLVEFVNAVSTPSLRRHIHRLLETLLGDPLVTRVPLSPQLLQLGIDLHRERPDKTWSLTDCISFVVMNE